MKKATSQKINDIAALVTGDTHLWGQIFNQHGSGLSSFVIAFLGPCENPPRLLLCRLVVIAFLGPGERLPRLRFVIDSPFWGQVRGCQDSGLSSTRLFGAK
jgi:hypothetical protein